MKPACLASVGAEIRRRRLAQNLTMKALAERARIHPLYLSKIERGIVDVGHAVLVRLAKALGASTAELFGPLPSFTSKALEAGRLFDNASPEIQRAVLAILQGISVRGRRR